MTRIKDLIKQWRESGNARVTTREVTLRLPLYDAARVMALARMYPGTHQAQILSELISAALDELEAALPYVPGKRAIALDDRGSPIYEDAGPTPKFYELIKKYEHALAAESAGARAGRKKKNARKK